jgi:hypothetical protein
MTGADFSSWRLAAGYLTDRRWTKDGSWSSSCGTRLGPASILRRPQMLNEKMNDRPTVRFFNVTIAIGRGLICKSMGNAFRDHCFAL